MSSTPYQMNLASKCAKALEELYPRAEIERFQQNSLHFVGKCRKLQYTEEREVILAGPAGTGKTLACLWKMYRLAKKYKGFRGAIVRQTRVSMSTTVLVTFERDVLGIDNPLVTKGPTKAGRNNYVLPNGSEINVIGLDNPAKFLSGEFDLIYVVQAEEILEDSWMTLMTRLRNHAMPYQQMIADCNPSYPNHWIKRRAEEGGLLLWETTHKDNPAMWDRDKQQWTEYGAQYIAILDALDGALKARYRYGIWSAHEGVIFNAYDEEHHKIAGFIPPSHWPRVVGIDPMGEYIAALWLAFDPADEILHVYREYCEPFGVSTPEHVRAIREASRGETIWGWAGGGPSERQARADFKAAGIDLQESGLVEVWPAIDRIIQLLKSRKIVIHDSCERLLNEFATYRRKKVRGEITDTIENKGAYHTLDALRYAIGYITQGYSTQEIKVVPVRERAY